MSTTVVDPDRVLRELDHDVSRLAEMAQEIVAAEQQYSVALIDSALHGGKDTRPAQLKAELLKLREDRAVLEERVEAVRSLKPELVRRQRGVDFHRLLLRAAPAITEYDAAHRGLVDAAVTLGAAVERWQRAEADMLGVSSGLDHLRSAAHLAEPIPHFPSCGLSSLFLPGGQPLLTLLKALGGWERRRPLAQVKSIMAPVHAAQARAKGRS